MNTTASATEEYQDHAPPTIVIKPSKNLLDINFKDVWNYRDLLWLLIRRDFVAFYKQTILGPLWFFIQPLFTTVTYTLVFSSIAHVSTNGIAAPLFYLAGLTWWNYYAECLNKTSTVFKDNSNVFGKVYFPRLIMPLSIVFSNLIRFFIQLLLFFIVMGFYAIGGKVYHINEYALLLPYLIVLIMLFGLGTGMIVSALTTKYRDLIYLITFGIQLLMYTTTVVYPLSAAPHRFKWLVYYNPITPILETFRYGFLGAGSFSWHALGISSISILFIAVIGIVIFNKVERDFIDTV